MQYILPRLGSNLFPISLDGGRLRRGTSSFKFENMLLEEGFKYLLKTKRAGFNFNDSSSFILVAKIESFKVKFESLEQKSVQQD